MIPSASTTDTDARHGPIAAKVCICTSATKRADVGGLRIDVKWLIYTGR